MTIETSFERSMQPDAPKRVPGLIEIAFWAVGFACVVFTTCYAYHIGI